MGGLESRIGSCSFGMFPGICDVGGDGSHGNFEAVTILFAKFKTDTQQLISIDPREAPAPHFGAAPTPNCSVIYLYIYIYMYLFIYLNKNTYICICLFIYVYIYIYISLLTFIYLNLYTYIHIFIYTSPQNPPTWRARRHCPERRCQGRAQRQAQPMSERSP